MFRNSQKKNHKNIWIFIIIVLIPKYVIAVVNTYFKYSIINNIALHTHPSILTTIINLSYYEVTPPPQGLS